MIHAGTAPPKFMANIFSIGSASLLLLLVAFVNYFYLFNRTYIEVDGDPTEQLNPRNRLAFALFPSSNLTDLKDYRDDVSLGIEKGNTKILETSPKSVTFKNPYTNSSVSPYKNESKVEYIMVVSSLGRSGSSWAGELIFQIGNAFYVYEPDRFTENVARKEINSEQGVEFLKRQFLCDFDQDFVEWVRDVSPRKPSTIFRSNLTRSCQRKMKCIHKDLLDEECQGSAVKMVKTIRVHLESTLQLLTDSDLVNLKIVYLIRDPRAAMNSRKNLGWNADPKTKCQIVNEDLKWYRRIRQDFPDRIYLLRYETLCTDTENEATRLWRFLTNSPNAPLNPNWSSFLDLTSKLDLRQRRGNWNSYSILRNTKSEWLLWRNEFHNETYLREIERHCEASLSAFGFNKFGSIKTLRDLSYRSLRSEEECPELPCSVS